MYVNRTYLTAAAVLLAAAVALFLARRGGGMQPGAAPPSPGAAGAAAAAPGGAAGGGASAPGAAAGPAAGAPAPAPRAAGEVVLRGTWGSQAGQFGRKRDPESNPEAPMALAAGEHGEYTVVDQVNRRIERFRGGERTGSIALGGDTIQDVALGAGGRVAVLDRMVDKNVQIYGPDGKLQNEIPLQSDAIKEPGDVTGVFADEHGVYVERGHGTVVRIADGTGARAEVPAELPGRPTRDGTLYVSAALLDRASGQVVVKAVTRASGQPAWQQVVQFGAPVLHLLLLDSDRQGRVYLGATTGHEDDSPPYRILDESIQVVRLGSGGTERGRLSLPPQPEADESFRPLSVDADGTVYVMSPRSEGLIIARYPFP